MSRAAALTVLVAFVTAAGFADWTVRDIAVSLVDGRVTAMSLTPPNRLVTTEPIAAATRLIVVEASLVGETSVRSMVEISISTPEGSPKWI